MLLKRYELDNFAASLYGKVVRGSIHYLVILGDKPFTFDDYIEASIFFDDAICDVPPTDTVFH